jgi:hypothetical protein
MEYKVDGIAYLPGKKRVPFNDGRCSNFLTGEHAPCHHIAASFGHITCIVILVYG